MSNESDEEVETKFCPLCVEEIDQSDKNFLPCPCGYQVCMWCWHHIRENLNGLCPACRTPYSADPHVFSAIDRNEVVKKNREKKLREKADKKVIGISTDKMSASIKSSVVIDRKHLHNYRVVQRNLVYVIGLPSTCGNDDILRKADYFGQYGKITKVVIHRNSSTTHSTVSAYVTFQHKEDAKAAIHALDNFWIDGHALRASFGTTKYCNNFIRHLPCNNPDCVYLHELGEEDDRFTKEEIQAGHTKLAIVPGKDQSIVTGNGGPSGTGKRLPSGTEPVLPPPVFLQDNPIPRPPSLSRSTTSTSVPQSSAANNQINASNATGYEEEGINKDLESSRSLPKRGEEKYLQENLSDLIRPNVAPETLNNGTDRTYSGEVSASAPSNSFNGLSRNAVFPVPLSSLYITMWKSVLKVSAASPDLSVNPFTQSDSTFSFSFSELLDLTLPPVDNPAASSYGAAQQSLPAPSAVKGTLKSLEGRSAIDPISSTGFMTLRQIFPGVNLNYSSPSLSQVTPPSDFPRHF